MFPINRAILRPVFSIWCAAALLSIFADSMLAARQCDAFGRCRVYISNRPVNPIQQQTPVWCWAASLSMLFGYYKHPVDQAAIVTNYFGAPIAVPGSPWVMRDALNRTWTDLNGRRFRVTSRITDYYGGSSFQISNADIVEAIASEDPVFYGDSVHAMVLVQVDYLAAPIQPIIVAGWAIDPYPGTGFGFRELRPDEMQATFAAISRVEDVSASANIGSVVNVAGQTDRLTSGAWMTVYGTALSTIKRAWESKDFTASSLPKSLSGIGVTVNGKPAYVGYVSPTQINFLAPADAALGPVTITVTNESGSSNPVSVAKQAVAPAFFMFSQGGGRYAIATLPDGSYVGPAGLLGGGASVRPARPGDVIALWMSGLGPTSPPYPEGRLVTENARIGSTISVLIGGTGAAIDWAGVVGAGLYQVNVRVPNVANGDSSIQVIVGGVPAQSGAFINVQR